MKKMKKALALILALVMALSLATVASAAEPTSPDVKLSSVISVGKDASVEGTFAKDVEIYSEYEGFNPIIVKDSEYTISDSKITLKTDGDGTVANDFVGYGSAIVAYGSDLWIEDTEVYASGVGALAIFSDNGSDVVIENSKMHSDGGTLYESYKNSPDQSTMVAPPWILGIMGSSRVLNIMGNESSATILNSEMTAAQWALLSTDSGTNMQLNVVDSKVELTGADYDLQDGPLYGDKDNNPYTKRAGYGSYTIGNANEVFMGVEMIVGTYANIFTGGSATYEAIGAGETVKLYGHPESSKKDEVLATYTNPLKIDKYTNITSDTFGFMIHQGTNKLTIKENTTVTSGYTMFLMKTGCSMDAVIDSSNLVAGNGILIQLMDNDDATTGMDVSTFSFYTEHKENAGWPSKGTNSVGKEASFAFSNGLYEGDIFNATGWEANSSGAQSPIALTVKLSNKADLVAQISSTTAIHVTYEGSEAVKNAPVGQKASDEWLKYQDTSFSISEYYQIGQVANKVQSHGLNSIDVVIDETSTWTVTADGIVRNVTAPSKAIVADKPVTVYVEGTLTLDGVVYHLSKGNHTVGNVTYVAKPIDYTLAPIDVSGWKVGDNKTGYPDLSTGGAMSVLGTDAAVKVVDADLSGDVSKGDAVLQYEASTMLGWIGEDGKTLTTTYPAAEGGMGGGPGGGPGGPGGGPGGPGGGEADTSAWYSDDLVVYVKDGVVVEPGTEGAVGYYYPRLMTGASDSLGSFTNGGKVSGGDDDYAFIAGIYVKDNAVYDVDTFEYITHGSFKTDAAMPRYTAEQNENLKGIEIIDSVSWHNGVIYDAAGNWTMSDVTIVMDTKADGSDTNDFSGLGAAVMVNGAEQIRNPEGKPVIVTIEDSTIETVGVAKLALFTDNGAVTIVKNSKLSAEGGVIYDGYMSTADQNVMVSPPWVLGLGGDADEPCNARTTNLMGDYSVAAYVDSYFYAKGWGALSVDSGTNMNMVIVNSDIDVETSGYGAYNIGNSTEDYYGSRMDVSTYAIIMTGGETTWKSYVGGTEIPVVQFAGETNAYGHGINGTEVAKVSSNKVDKGVVVPSEIISDNFGFMCHNNGSSGWNVVNVLDGTKVTTGDAIFLVKKINAEFNVDNAVLKSGNNTLVQIIDNDDDYVGLDFAASWGEENEYGHTVGGHMPTFNSKFSEAAGYSNEWIAESSAAHRATLEAEESEDAGVAPANMPPMGPGGPGGGASGPYDVADNWVVNYNMTNTVATGDLWNSTGYVGSNPATTMNVTLGKGAELTGIISAGAFSHDVKEATVGNGDWTGAEALGHVSNIVYSNGVNLVNVVLTDDATWNVTGNCVVNDLTASSKSIEAEKAVKITVEGTLTLDGKVVKTSTTVGNVTFSIESPKTGDNSYVVVMACVALAAAACFVVLNKKKA